MLKKLSERFPAASAKGSAMYESLAQTATSKTTNEATSPGGIGTDGDRNDATASPATSTSSPSPSLASPASDAPSASDHGGLEDASDRTGSSRASVENRAAAMRAALSERINSETVSSAASSMFGLMKKAQHAAEIAAREGAAKATVWKSRAMDIADMDALQRKLSYALDRSGGEVNTELLNFSYVTDSIVAMGFPSMNSGGHRTYIKDNPIDLVAMYLNTKHGGHYMIWNLSEETYDYAYLDNQVLEFNFPGHPAPPLGLLFKMCSSIENWLDADDKNLAAVHCLTGKGRTGTVIACYLAWVGMFPNALEALEYVAEQRQTTAEKLTIPSQRRYIQYFNHVMDGLKPRSSPLLLRRVIMNTIPVFGQRKTLEPVKKPAVTADSGSEEVPETTELMSSGEPEMREVVQEGSCPYLQIFKSGKLVFTTTWRDMETGNGVQWANVEDGSISFSVNCMLQGDILVRCRHLTDTGERTSMFRGAFHTGYIPDGVLRLTKAQLDGACGDDRFDQDFFIDLIFADVQTEGEGGDVANAQSEGISLNEEDRQAYEDMLHRDEAFWIDIEARKVRLQKQREEQLKKKKELEAAKAAEEAAAAEAAEIARVAALAEKEAEEAAKKKALQASKASSFSISGADEDSKLPKRTNRKSSWNEENDKELMSELESFTSGALAKAAADDTEEKSAVPAAANTTSSANVTDGCDPMSGLAKDFEDMKKLEEELGLDAFSSEFENLPHGNLNDLSPTSLSLLNVEVDGFDDLAGGKATSGGKSGKDVDDVMNFGADDFDELEEYLSGLSSSKS